MSVVVAMGKFTSVQTEYAIKDNLPKTATTVPAQIVVGTPGTMTDLIRRKVINVSEVKVFVLDEADNMLDQDGLGEQTLRVKKYAQHSTCESCTCRTKILLRQHASTFSCAANYPLLRHVP